MKPAVSPPPLQVMLADDDKDDHYFFKKALNELSFPAHYSSADDGEKLMDYLSNNSENLPDVLFLDLNMPRKNGSECLLEIKTSPALKNLPVIIYSTSLPDPVSDVLYENGAHYYFCKRDYSALVKSLERVLALMVKEKFVKPAQNDFIINE